MKFMEINYATFFLFVAVLVLIILFSCVWTRKLKKAQAGGRQNLSRHQNNPIICPDGKQSWESQGTFNPTAIKDNKGGVHILYRAIGDDGVSRLGYASTSDGLNINERFPVPVFVLQNPRRQSNMPKQYNPGLYLSGGSWGGVEDPRLVSIDGVIYMTFNAFDGWDFLRVSSTSISEKDFYQKKWRWTKPLFLSPINKVNKNWVLFPEKINGKFAIIHSISPDLQIDYVDRLEDLDSGRVVINSKYGNKKIRKEWDSWPRGVGPSPIKTKFGWLVLYHATEKKEPSRYKLGAMLLDLKNPKKIIARGNGPILSPDEWYENDSKPGIVYSCGAIIKDDVLHVYYGGGDKHTCVATAPLKQIISNLKPVKYI